LTRHGHLFYYMDSIRLPMNATPDHPSTGATTDRLAAWAAPAGFSLLVTTILFLMGLVVAGVLGRSVPCESRGLIVFVVALTAGASAGFLTGSAQAEGRIPFFGGNVLSIAASGAIATIVIVLTVGFRLYVPLECGGDPTEVTEAEKTTARTLWQHLYSHNWEGAYAIFPATIRQRSSFAEFSNLATHYLSQFSAPPNERVFESGDITSGTLVVSFIAAFDGVSRFRETLAFQRQGDAWVPWTFDVFPVTWPLVNGYRTVAESATSVWARFRNASESERSSVRSQVVGSYILPQQAGWSVIIESAEISGGVRTCDVKARSQVGDAPITMRSVLDGCAVPSGAIVKVAGRVASIGEAIVVDTVRFWREA
jgi:hypothetical protein